MSSKSSLTPEQLTSKARRLYFRNIGREAVKSDLVRMETELEGLKELSEKIKSEKKPYFTMFRSKQTVFFRLILIEF